MIPLHTRCRKCSKCSPPLNYSIHESPSPPDGWRTVIISTGELNKYRDYIFCPDCLPALLKELPSP